MRWLEKNVVRKRENSEKERGSDGHQERNLSRETPMCHFFILVAQGQDLKATLHLRYDPFQTR